RPPYELQAACRCARVLQVLARDPRPPLSGLLAGPRDHAECCVFRIEAIRWSARDHGGPALIYHGQRCREWPLLGQGIERWPPVWLTPGRVGYGSAAIADVLLLASATLGNERASATWPVGGHRGRTPELGG